LRPEPVVPISGIAVLAIFSEDIFRSQVIGCIGMVGDQCVCADGTYKLYEVHATAATNELALLRRTLGQ
jgi:hypothetical protein